MKQLLSLIVILGALVSNGPTLFAQPAAVGVFSGTLTGPGGVTIANATVTITNSFGAVVGTVTTNSLGQFSLSLPLLMKGATVVAETFTATATTAGVVLGTATGTLTTAGVNVAITATAAQVIAAGAAATTAATAATAAAAVTGASSATIAAAATATAISTGIAGAVVVAKTEVSSSR